MYIKGVGNLYSFSLFSCADFGCKNDMSCFSIYIKIKIEKKDLPPGATRWMGAAGAGGTEPAML